MQGKSSRLQDLKGMYVELITLDRQESEYPDRGLLLDVDEYWVVLRTKVLPSINIALDKVTAIWRSASQKEDGRVEE